MYKRLGSLRVCVQDHKNLEKKKLRHVLAIWKSRLVSFYYFVKQRDKVFYIYFLSFWCFLCFRSEQQLVPSSQPRLKGCRVALDSSSRNFARVDILQMYLNLTKSTLTVVKPKLKNPNASLCSWETSDIFLSAAQKWIPSIVFLSFEKLWKSENS